MAIDPKDQQELNQLYNDYIALLQKADRLSYAEAKNKADAAKASNTLAKEVERVNKELNDVVFQTDYVYRSFQEQTAELKNQNNILKIGKSLFTDLTSVAQKLNNFQQGYGDLREKDFKKLKDNLEFQTSENKKIIKDLKDGEGFRKKEIKNLKDLEGEQGRLSSLQRKRLNELLKEEDLYRAAVDAQANGIPILEKELQISKQIYKTREDLGGLTKAAASVIQQYGGSLAQYLDVSEAIEAVDDYNKKVIDNALKQKDVLDELKRIDEEKLQLEKDVIIEQNLSLELLDQITKKQVELNNLKQLEENTQALSNLSLESNVSALTQKRDLVQNILGSLNLEQSKQDEIINKIDRQISLKQQLEQNESRLAEIEQERINLSIALADNIIDQQEHTNRLNTLNREGQDISVNSISLGRKLAQASMEVNEVLRDGSELQTKINNKLSDRLSVEKEISNTTDNYNNAIQSAQQKEIGLASALNEKEKEAYAIKQAAIKATSTGLTGFINKFKSLSVLIDNLNFTKVLTDPVTLMTTLVNIGFKANSQAVELGKSFGISAKEAGEMRGEMAEFARSTGDTFINTDRLLKAQSELSKELGIAVKFSNEELATFAKLTELTGLTAQEAGKLAMASATAGMSTEDYTGNIREAAFFAMQSTNTHFEMKEVMQDISKLSAGTLVKFQGNPTAIAKAVIEAKKLGATLDQIDKIGESLLNFESSIENELKAELMTGRQLNMERARAAALTGDQLTLTREVSDQVGSLNDFQKMNVLAQKSLAEAFGMSRDEMAEMLMKQEAINKYGKEAADLNKDQLQALKDSGLSAKEFLEKQEQQRTAQAKFQDAMVKLQTIIANLVDGPVGELLDAFADIVGSAMNILKIFEPLFKLISFTAKQLGTFAGTDLGKIVLSIGAVSLFLPKIVTGLGLATKGVMGLGKGLFSIFKADTWSNWGKGLQSVFSKDKFGGFFKSLKDKFLEAAGLSKKLEEGLTDKVTGAAADKVKEAAAGATEKVVEAGEESLTDKLKDKATETIEGKVEDKAGELQDKIMGGAEETEGEAEEVEGGSDGSKFKEKMKNIAEGIKAFGNGKVILGGLVGLPASSVGLIAMLPGVLGIKAIERVKGEKFQLNMYGIAYGIEAFGSTRVTGGAANLIVASIGLIAMIPGVVGAKLIEQINGVKFEAAMLGLSTGLSSMGSLTVTGGAANLIAASVGLVAMIPGVAGAKLIEFINGTKFTESMIGLATGLTAMGSLTVTGGSANLLAASLGLIAMIPGVVGAKLIELLNGPKLSQSLIGLAVGLSAMGTVPVLIGAAALIPAALGLTAMIAGVAGGALLGVAGPLIQTGLTSLSVGLTTFGTAAMNPMVWAGIGLLAAFNVALIPLGYTLKLMAPAIESFGKAIKSAFEGLATVITAAATGISIIFSSLENVDVLKLLAIGPALIGIGAGLAALGAGGVIEAIGSFLGGDPIEKIERLAASGKGLSQTSIALQTLSNAVVQLNASLTTLDVSKLYAIGPALNQIGNGLASLGGGNVLGAISSFLGGDPIEKLERLAATGDGLQKTAVALQSIAGALSGISTALANIDLSKINKLKESSGIPTVSNNINASEVSKSEDIETDNSSIFSGITDFFTSPIKTTNKPVGENANKEETINAGIDLTPMIKAINEVKASVDKLYNKNTSINMDGKKVGTTLVQSSYKFA